MLFYGGYGIGKTTMAKIIAEEVGTYPDYNWDSDHNYIRFDSYKEAETTSQLIKRLTVATIYEETTNIWILDEFEKLHPKYQARFLGVLEDRTYKNSFLIIANDANKIHSGIYNRCNPLNFDLPPEYQNEMISGLIKMGTKILKKEKISFDKKQLEQLAGRNWACPRTFVNSLELFSLSGELQLL
jgi:replication-associated recombination protein RarA